MSRSLLFLVVYFALFVPISNADDPLFSGPQAGEQLPNFSALRVFGSEEDNKQSGDKFDFVAEADGSPILLIFFHEKTRPAFGLTNAMTKFAKTLKKSGLKTCVIFLTDDRTEMVQWAKNVRKHLTEGTTYGVSPEGKEGPGNYGLNRNVKLTILVGNQGKVTKSFAIGQPQLEVDGPAILEAIVNVSGGGKVPEISELAGPAMRQRDRKTKDGAMRDGAMRDGPKRDAARGQNDAKLTSMLRKVINKQAEAEQIKESAKAVEAYVAENANAKKELARISNTIVRSGKLGNYGTQAAQDILKSWAKKYPHADRKAEETK